MKFIYSLTLSICFLQLNNSAAQSQSDSFIFDYFISHSDSIANDSEQVHLTINRPSITSCRGGTAVFIETVTLSPKESWDLPARGWISMRGIDMYRPIILFMDPNVDAKYIEHEDIVHLGLRRTEDFTLFFSKPIRQSETGVYVDGVRLINP